MPSRKTQRQVEAPGQINLGPGEGKLDNGLARLVLTVVEVLRQVLEKQALRRADSSRRSNGWASLSCSSTRDSSKSHASLA